MKHEWKKQEKMFYQPKNKPEVVDVPEFKYFIISGEGNPNGELFAGCIGVLYSLSYAVRMSYKKDYVPEGYFDYTVYPLEGVWDISDDAKDGYTGVLDKDKLVFDVMIRQPDFVTDEFAKMIIDITKKKKPHELLDKVRFDTVTDGKCIQMMHLGSYDDESTSFDIMQKYAQENGYARIDKNHREIYLNDARKTAPEKLKTVLRFWVE